MGKPDGTDKTQDKGADGGGDASEDLGASNPTAINAPERTGGQMNASTTTSSREPQFDPKPLDALAPSNKAEEEVQRAVEEAMHQEYVQSEAVRRVAAARADRMMAAVNTENPYGLEPGQKPLYVVNGHLVDPDGNRVKKVSDARSQSPDTVIDKATSMKKM